MDIESQVHELHGVSRHLYLCKLQLNKLTLFNESHTEHFNLGHTQSSLPPRTDHIGSPS